MCSGICSLPNDLASTLAPPHVFRGSMYTQRSMTEQDLLELMIRAAISAGRAAFQVYQGHFEVQLKADDSPVTTADHAAGANHPRISGPPRARAADHRRRAGGSRPRAPTWNEFPARRSAGWYA